MIDSLLARRCWWSFLLATTGVALALLSAPAHAAWDVDQLMQALAQNKSGRATFVEKKYIAMLDRPVESSGDLLYTAPDRLEKRTLKPKPESMVLEGNTLTIERGRRQYVLALQDYPELGAFTESIRGTLAGDQKTLARIYNITLEGSEARWTLTLRPIESRMAAAVQRVVIHGSHAELLSIEIEQADKDRSVMTITSTTPP